MTDADRLQKMLARAEAEVSKLKDLLKEWEKWEAALIEDEDDGSLGQMSDVNYEWMIRLQNQRNEALKR